MNTLTHALGTFSENLTDIKQSCKENIENIIKSNLRVVVKDKNEQWVRDKVRTLQIQKQIEYPLRVIKRITMIQAPKRKGQITDEHIQRAKEYPFEDLLDTRRIRVGGKWKFKTQCPLHNDKSPSFFVDKNNGWHCFGCSEGGDTIAFLMKKDKTDFINSVKQLCTTH